MSDLGWDVCVVLDEHRVVLGLLREAASEGAAKARVSEVMERAPRTFRPNGDLPSVLKAMQRADLGSALVTTGDGVFVGVLRRSEVEQATDRSS